MIDADPPPAYQRRIVSGVRPTGHLHVGNYYGAIRDHIGFQQEYVGGAFYFIADLHEMTTVSSGQSLRQRTREAAIDYLALGLNEHTVTFYRQSDVPQITELMWILSCVTPHSWLELAHAFKEAEANDARPSAALFMYPALMAADILAIRATEVPVGTDQLQNIELTRDIASRWNNQFGSQFFPIPEPRLASCPEVPGTNGFKMSKAHGNDIPIFADAEEIQRAVRSIRTSGSAPGAAEPEDDVVLRLLALVTDEGPEYQEMKDAYAAGEVGFERAKEALTEAIIAAFAPCQEARREWSQRPGDVDELLREGGERARMEAIQTLEVVREAVGIAGYEPL